MVSRRNKVVSAQEAAGRIRDGDTVATGGFVGIGFAETIAVALEQRFLDTQAETGCGAPRKLTLEQAIAYIDDDEMVEVTPKSIRLRKRHLDPHERKRQSRAEG